MISTQAQKILDAMDASDQLDTAQLSSYTADIAYDLNSPRLLFHLATGTPMFKTKNDDVSPKGLRKLVKRCFDLDRKLAVAAPRPTTISLATCKCGRSTLSAALTPAPVERNKHFPGGKRAVPGTASFPTIEALSAKRLGLDDKMDKLLEEMRASQAQILRGVNASAKVNYAGRDSPVVFTGQRRARPGRRTSRRAPGDGQVPAEGYL